LSHFHPCFSYFLDNVLGFLPKTSLGPPFFQLCHPCS
jgi:hypothetical protein